MRLVEILIEDMTWRKHPNVKGVLTRSYDVSKVEADKKVKAAEKKNKAAAKKADLHRAFPPIRKPVVDYAQLARKIEEVVSGCVPDGDPIDRLVPWLENHGVRNDFYDHLDTAVKKFIKPFKTYNDYLIDMWDGYYEGIAEETSDTDYEEELEALKKENPWR
jgi:hypothetical protein